MPAHDTKKLFEAWKGLMAASEKLEKQNQEMYKALGPVFFGIHSGNPKASDKSMKKFLDALKPFDGLYKRQKLTTDKFLAEYKKARAQYK